MLSAVLLEALSVPCVIEIPAKQMPLFLCGHVVSVSADGFISAIVNFGTGVL